MIFVSVDSIFTNTISFESQRLRAIKSTKNSRCCKTAKVKFLNSFSQLQRFCEFRPEPGFSLYSFL